MEIAKKIALSVISLPLLAIALALELFAIPLAIFVALPICVFVGLIQWLKGDFDIKDLLLFFFFFMFVGIVFHPTMFPIVYDT